MLLRLCFAFILQDVLTKLGWVVIKIAKRCGIISDEDIREAAREAMREAKYANISGPPRPSLEDMLIERKWRRISLGLEEGKNIETMEDKDIETIIDEAYELGREIREHSKNEEQLSFHANGSLQDVRSSP